MDIRFLNLRVKCYLQIIKSTVEFVRVKATNEPKTRKRMNGTTLTPGWCRPKLIRDMNVNKIIN